MAADLPPLVQELPAVPVEVAVPTTAVEDLVEQVPPAKDF
jgi:hypothetical protein